MYIQGRVIGGFLVILDLVVIGGAGALSYANDVVLLTPSALARELHPNSMHK